MNLFTRTILLFGLLLTVIFPTISARADSPGTEAPPGFSLISSIYGIEMYRKDYSGGNPDFVQVVDLSLGASIQLMHGGIAGSGRGKGVFGGPSAKIEYRSIESYWNELEEQNPETAFCVTNGQFFFMADNPTRLSLPIKRDGKIVSEGYAANDFPGETLIFEIWSDHADIRELTRENLYGSTAPNIIGGLTAEANKRAKQSTGRTFVGVDDRNRDGLFETILVFNTKTATQAGAAEVLTSFGADKVMMLDGGGSTQLICQDTTYIASGRPIPQAVGIVGAPQPSLAARVVTQPVWPVFVQGEEIHLEVEIENTGSETWMPGEYEIVVQRAATQTSVLPLEITVPPGEALRLELPVKEDSSWGVYDMKWWLRRGEARFPEEPVLMQFIVLPPELEQFRPNLEAQIQGWVQSNPEQIPRLAVEWINDRRVEVLPAPRVHEPAKIEVAAKEPAQLEKFELSDLVWVPLTVMPIALFVLFAISRRVRLT